jgi:hypothetical protein
MARGASLTGSTHGPCAQAREAAARSVVLLRNQGPAPLPLDLGRLFSIAVVGPN